LSSLYNCTKKPVLREGLKNGKLMVIHQELIIITYLKVVCSQNSGGSKIVPIVR
jgi:hypothetical protein